MHMRLIGERLGHVRDYTQQSAARRHGRQSAARLEQQDKYFLHSFARFWRGLRARGDVAACALEPRISLESWLLNRQVC